MSAKFYDPLGIVSPITILFKMFFQQLCKAKINWDKPITGDLAETWKKLCSAVKSSEALVVPRCYLDGVEDQVRLTSLVGFCDASTKGAVVYMRLETESRVHVRFICAKTRVAPLQTITVPRLELSSALLLSRLISSIQSALESGNQCVTPIRRWHYFGYRVIVNNGSSLLKTEWSPFIH